MKRYKSLLGAVAISVIATGCGTNGNATIPGTSQANLSTNKLELAVGTAYNANGGALGLNVVTSYRQPSGLSGTAANNPSITGPFTVPQGFPGAYVTPPAPSADAGTHSITSSPQVPLNVNPPNSTLGTFTGAFSYGLAPLNSDQQNVNAYYPGNPNATPGNGFAYGSTYDPNGNLPWWFLPIGAPSGAQNIFLLGPPAVPFFNNGTFPAAFAGYSPGFTIFAIAPVAGSYTETVNVVAANNPGATATANATLSSVTPLPAPVLSGVTGSGGGLSGTVTVGADPRIVETIVFVWDQTSNLFYSAGPIKGTGAQTFSIPANLGPCSGTNCQSGSGASPSFASGDTYVVSAVTFDYPAFEAGPPGNVSQTPTLTQAPANQADLAIGTYFPGTY